MAQRNISYGMIAGMSPAQAYLALFDDPSHGAVLAGHAAVSMIDNFEGEGEAFPKEVSPERAGPYPSKSNVCGFTLYFLRGKAVFTHDVALPVEGLARAVMEDMFRDNAALFTTTSMDSEGDLFYQGMSANNALKHPYTRAMMGL